MSVHNGLAANVVPPNGFHFIQILKDGKTHKIEGAASWQELENQVLRFRLEQISLVAPERADPEHVAEDIHDYICRNYPTSCVDKRAFADLNRPHGTGAGFTNGSTGGEHESAGDQTFRKFIPLIQRIAEWLGQLGQEPKPFTTPAEADRRAAICMTCPQNLRFETSCGPCNQNVRMETIRILGTRKTRHDQNLLGCRAIGWTNRIAVWLDTDKIESQSLPDKCWCKK
jgi:hypothetical protein